MQYVHYDSNAANRQGLRAETLSLQRLGTFLVYIPMGLLGMSIVRHLSSVICRSHPYMCLSCTMHCLHHVIYLWTQSFSIEVHHASGISPIAI